MKTRKIVFECRFGKKEGWGHLVRCSALAQAAQLRGWRTCLLSGSKLNIAPAEVQEAFDICVERDGSSLDVCPEELKDANALVIDEMYWSDDDIGRLVNVFKDASKSGNLMSVGMDDMQRRSMRAVNIVVNTELGLKKAFYDKDCIQLLGEKYCMLRKGFANPADIDWRPGKNIIPILVMLGGTDAFGLSQQVLQELLSIEKIRFAPVLISGNATEPDSDLERLLSSFSDYKWLCKLDSSQIAGWMKACQCAIIGCGSSTFEMAVSSLPFVGLSMVDNQIEMARAIEKHWKMPVIHLTNGDTAFSRFRESILDLVTSFEDIRRRSFAELDSRGSNRILDVVEKSIPD